MMSALAVSLHFGPKNNVAEHDKLLSRAYSDVLKGIQNKGFDAFISNMGTRGKRT